MIFHVPCINSWNVCIYSHKTTSCLVVFYSIVRAKVTHFCYFHNTPFHTHYLLPPATLRLLDLCNRIHRQVRGIVVLLQLQIPLIPAYFLCIFQEQGNTSVRPLRTRSFSRPLASFHGLLYFHTSAPAYLIYSIFINYCSNQKNRIRLSYPALAFHFLFFAYFCLTKYGLHQHHRKHRSPSYAE